MTPLTRWHETDSGDVAEDIGEPYIDKDAQMMIRKLREENGRLHKTIEDLKRRSEREETDSSQCPSPLPRSHSLRSIEKKQTRVPPVPAPRSNKSLIAQMSNQTYKEALQHSVVDDEMARSAVEELNYEAKLSNDLSKMRLQSTPRSRHVQYHPRPPCASQPQHTTSAQPAHGPSYSHDQRCISPKPYIRNLSPSPYSHIRERTDDYPRPHYQPEDLVPHPPPPPTRERTYRGPIPSIPDFTAEDPRQFARL